MRTPDTQRKLDLIMDRFVHEGSFYIRQTRDAYIQVKDRAQTPCIFTDTQLVEHLKKTQTFAPYQISGEDTLKWICLDIDGDGASDEAIQQFTHKVAKAAQKLLGPKTALVEGSGSKGYHVWILFEEPIPTIKGHRLGRMIESKVAPIEGINLEVYPKQKTKKRFGNTVKLPLGIHQKTGKRCLFVNAQFKPYEDQWQRLQDVERVPATWIDEHIEEEATPTRYASSAETSAQEWTPLCLTQIMNEGCAQGMRDEAAFALACYSKKKGYPGYLGYGILTNWNERNRPPLDDTKVDQKIRSAYSNDYGFKTCKNPKFDRYCHSSCSFFEKKMEDRGKLSIEEARGVISHD
jgi:hypothetical protein